MIENYIEYCYFTWMSLAFAKCNNQTETHQLKEQEELK